jgi:tight adherence protein B
MISPLVAASAAAVAVGAGASVRGPARRPSSDSPSTGLARAGLSIPPAVASVGSAVAGVAVGSVLAGPIGMVILGIAGAVIPASVRRHRVAKRAGLVEQQLLEMVVSLAATLRAGRSLEQALEVAGDEVPAPVGPTIVAMTDRVSLGSTLKVSLEVWASEISSAEGRLIAGVLGLQRRTGGALSGPLDELATTLRSRQTAARELRSLTAQARLSAAILGLLPIGFFLFLSTVSRHDIESAISTPSL